MTLQEKYEHIKKHNQVSNDRAQSALKAGHNVCITQATGTGKTYQVLQIIHDMCTEGWISGQLSVLIVVPTGALVDQWAASLSNEEKGFARDLRDAGLIESATKTGQKHFELKNGKSINYMYRIITYSKFSDIAGVKGHKPEDDDYELTPEQEAKIANFAQGYNLVILDEVHRAGAKTYAGATKQIIRNSGGDHYVVGITATPVRGDGIDVTKFFTTHVKGVTRSEGQTGDYEYYDDNGEIQKGGQEQIIPNTNVVLSLVYDPRLSSCRALKNFYERWAYSIPDLKKQDYFVKLVKDIFKELDIGEYAQFARSQLPNTKPQRLLCFYQKGENVKAVADFCRRVFGISNIHDVHSRNTAKENEDAFKAFTEDSDEDCILLSIDMINEGIHTEGVTGIIMLRRTFSHVIFNQQTGRAMDYRSRHLTIPVFDIVGNSAIQTSVEKGSAKEDIEEFIQIMNGKEAFAPGFKSAAEKLAELKAYCKQHNIKEPPMPSDGDAKKILFKASDGFWYKYLNSQWFSQFTFEELKDVYQDMLAQKGTYDPEFLFDIADFNDDQIKQQLYYDGTGVKVAAPIYLLCELWSRTHGKFRSYDEIAEWAIGHFDFNRKQVEQLYKYMTKQDHTKAGKESFSFRRFLTKEGKINQYIALVEAKYFSTALENYKGNQ